MKTDLAHQLGAIQLAKLGGERNWYHHLPTEEKPRPIKIILEMGHTFSAKNYNDFPKNR